MKNKTVAILPCKGIGDALLMQIAAEQLLHQGYDVTVVHPKLHELQSWFPRHKFVQEYDFSPTSWIIAENDNSPHIQSLKKQYRDRLSIFYPTYLASKHGPLDPLDRAFDPTKPMAENIATAIASLIGAPIVSKSNGITPPSSLIQRLHRNRVLIHHTSSAEEKNWLREKFDEVSRGLDKRGFEPVFVPTFGNLADLAAYVFESGFVIGNDSLVGHLASNLNIPTVIVADKHDRMQLWRPGWLEGAVVTLYPWLCRWRFFQRNWQYFIPSSRVLSSFDALAHRF